MDAQQIALARLDQFQIAWQQTIEAAAREQLPADQHLEPAQVKQAFRRRLLQVHPDHGGSREQLELVQAAFAEGRRLVEAG